MGRSFLVYSLALLALVVSAPLAMYRFQEPDVSEPRGPATPWYPNQATGEPNADPTRDDGRAWAPAAAKMGEQWLELVYAQADRLRELHIYEVLAFGSVVRVEAFDAVGSRHVFWKGRDPSRSPGAFIVTGKETLFPTRRVRVFFDTDLTANYDEIDAVLFVGASGRQWAQSATASSHYK